MIFEKLIPPATFDSIISSVAILLLFLVSLLSLLCGGDGSGGETAEGRVGERRRKADRDQIIT